MRLALKVDVDTYHGTCEGIPRLLALFARSGIRATFFFSLGPDNTGKAVKRIFTKGFVKKVMSASPAASYGIRTMLYGTLLPAPDIGTKRDAIDAMRRVRAEGHEVGIHAWDHVDWHDRLAGMSEEEVERVVARAHRRFEDVFGEKATLSAAPGWTATAISAAVQERNGIRISSDTRGGLPFHPLGPDGTACAVLDVPSTLPTLDELLAWERFKGLSGREAIVKTLRQLVREADSPSVHSIHTEIEGGRALGPLFAKQLGAWKEDGVRFVTVGEIAADALCTRTPVPARALVFTRVEGRALPVATQAAAPSAATRAG